MADDNNSNNSNDSESFSSSDDSVSETSSQGWLSKLGGAIKGVLIGLVMMIAAFPLLFWNEGRAVKTAKSLDEGRGAVVTAPSDNVNAANEGKLVHMTGRAKTSETVSDPVLGVSANALSLKRKVEMYQWKETAKSEKKDKVGGSTETVTTYTYAKEWSESAIESSKFKQQQGHRNPGSMPYKTEQWTAGKVTLGAYTLTPAQVGRISGDEPVTAAAPLSNSDTSRPLREHAGGLYAGQNPDQPQVGDLRILFTKVGESDITLVAKQIGTSFEPYRAKAGATVDLQRKGIAGADEMFASAEQSNAAMTWILRFVGYFVMAMGIGLMLKPLSVLASVLPILGDIIGAGAGFIAFLLAGVMSFTTIAVAWIFYRPLLGVALLAVAAGAVYGVMHLIKKYRATRPAPALKAA
jgi:Transmembrane protein 43